MSEPISEADLQAYADGHLPEERRKAVDAWLASRPEESERIAAYRRLASEVRAAYNTMLSEPVPPRLTQVAAAGLRWRRVAVVAGWIVLGILIGVPAGWYSRPERLVTQVVPADPSMIARRAAVAHATYSPEVRHPVEVGADDEQHLVTWLSKRLGVKVRAPKLDDFGMSLVGGRLLPGENGPVALFMYQSQNGRRLTLYVRTEASRNRETAFRYARENNVNVFYWIDREVGYALASADLTKDELLRLANLVYKQLEMS
ncbi:MAG: anti-sigma factor [Betaproteobacteria bacterium]|nr:anti-sigma factor [Betaproteobacteria bacterium]MBV9361651.1 anti-sigma factor [Betaproteobacteria bacterium]